MKKAFIFLLAIIFGVFLLLIAYYLKKLGPASKKFIIKEVLITDSLKWKNASDFHRITQNFFEDEKYIVTKECFGEFGGKIFFRNKKTGVVDSCLADCSVVINKINGKYFITNTLGHLDGSTEVLEIKNPDSLKIVTLLKPKNGKGKLRRFYPFDFTYEATSGTKTLIDTGRVLTIASFPYKGELYHVITNFHKTFLAKIENRKFVTIDTISNISVWTHNPEEFKTTDGHYIVVFDGTGLKGYLDIFKNNITVVRYL